MRQLYQQIFVTIVGVAVLCGVSTAVVGHLLGDNFRRVPPVVESTARYLVADLPSAPDKLRQVVKKRGRETGLAISIYGPGRRRLCAAGGWLPGPRAGESQSRWFHTPRHIGVMMPIGDGRWVSVGHRHHRGHSGAVRFVTALIVLLLFVLLGSYWAARRITRRLEVLGDGVTRLGQGELRVQIPVEGNDEVAALADQFNATSARVADLLEQQRRVLAGASHELRSPLARLRVAVEMLTGEGAVDELRRAALTTECEKDIEELDVLIDDILLGARLRDAHAEQRFAPVDLAALVAGEAQRVDASADVKACTVDGDVRALRSLVRNLLENARRYGTPPVSVSLAPTSSGATLFVEDEGTPLEVGERERIFEPFYRPPGHAEGQGGAGLGLSLVRDIALHHGGEIRYEVSPTGGSRFVVTLPVR